MLRATLDGLMWGLVLAFSGRMAPPLDSFEAWPFWAIAAIALVHINVSAAVEVKAETSRS